MTAVPEVHETRFKGYIPALDSVRGIAIILVLVQHWLEEGFWLNDYIPNGVIGVSLFFVLSGFLITGTLVRQKEKQDKGDTSIIMLWKDFLFKRFYRIVPAYYFTLIVIVLLDVPDIKESIGWHLTYLSNFYFLRTNTYPPFAHFWTLAIEVQFYLLWPWIILIFSRKRLNYFCWLLILSGPATRMLLYPEWSERTNWFTICYFDTLGFGALLAIHSYEKHLIFLKHLFFYLAYVLLLFALMKWMRIFVHIDVVKYTLATLVSAIAVYLSLYSRLVQKHLNYKWLIYLATISYSIYLFHNFLDFIFINYFPAVKDMPSLPYFLLKIALVVIISHFSYEFIEKPFLSSSRKRL